MQKQAKNTDLLIKSINEKFLSSIRVANFANFAGLLIDFINKSLA